MFQIMPTVRHLVKQCQLEIRDSSDLLPERAAVILNTLAALLGNCNDEIRQADADYARVLLVHLKAGGAANRARIEAETTPEFERKRAARDTKELTVELMRSLKYFLKSKAEELQLSRHL